MVSVGAPPGWTMLRLVGPEPVEVAAGETARLGVTVGTDARADLSAEAHLISPWGTWEWMGPAATGAELPAGGTVDSSSMSHRRRGCGRASGGRWSAWRAQESWSTRLRSRWWSDERRWPHVGGIGPIAEIDAREEALRAGTGRRAAPPGHQRGTAAAALADPAAGGRTSGGPGEHRGPTTGRPPPRTILPDVAARIEIGSVAAAVLTRAAGEFARVTAQVGVTDIDVAYHRRNPGRFAARRTDVVDFARARRAETAAAPGGRGAAPGLPAVARRAVRRTRRPVTGL